MLYLIGRILVAPFVRLIFRAKIENRAALHTKGPVIFICNHFSEGDPVLLACYSRRFIYFMAKESLFSPWYMNLLFRSLLVTPATLNGNSLAAVKRALELLKKGRAFGIFPEGHRCTDREELDDFERGTAFIALKAGAKVVPVYIDPASVDRRRMRMAVGNPVDSSIYADVKGPVKPVDLLTRRLEGEVAYLRTRVHLMMLEEEKK